MDCCPMTLDKQIDETTKTCPHCHHEYHDSDAYHCPLCGKGIRPVPCDCQETPTEPTVFREQKDKIIYVVWMECPKCHQKSHEWQRSRWAIDEWNRVIRGYWSEHFIPPKWRIM